MNTNEDSTNSQENEGVKPSVDKILKKLELFKFIDWLMLPEDLRVPKTQAELASELKVDVGTLTDWKKYVGFWDLVKAKQDEWGKDKTMDILKAFYTETKKKPTPQAVQLWLTIFNDFKEVKGIEVDDKREQTNKLDDILAELMKPDETTNTQETNPEVV